MRFTITCKAVKDSLALRDIGPTHARDTTSPTRLEIRISIKCARPSTSARGSSEFCDPSLILSIEKKRFKYPPARQARATSPCRSLLTSTLGAEKSRCTI
jgi:hypothetical protein